MSRVKPDENATTSCRQKDSRVSIHERLLHVQILKLKQVLCTELQKRNFTGDHFWQLGILQLSVLCLVAFFCLSLNSTSIHA